MTTCQSCVDSFYILYPQNISCVACVAVGQKLMVVENICVNCLDNCQICATDSTCMVCNNKFFLASPTNCKVQKKLTAYLSSTIDPQTYLLEFSDHWDFIFNNLRTIFSLQVSDIKESEYSYSLSTYSNTIQIYLNFRIYVNGDNVLSVNLAVQDLPNDEFLLLEKDFENLLSDYCPLPKTYDSCKFSEF